MSIIYARSISYDRARSTRRWRCAEAMLHRSFCSGACPNAESFTGWRARLEKQRQRCFFVFPQANGGSYLKAATRQAPAERDQVRTQDKSGVLCHVRTCANLTQPRALTILEAGGHLSVIAGRVNRNRLQSRSASYPCSLRPAAEEGGAWTARSRRNEALPRKGGGCI